MKLFPTFYQLSNLDDTYIGQALIYLEHVVAGGRVGVDCRLIQHIAAIYPRANLSFALLTIL